MRQGVDTEVGRGDVALCWAMEGVKVLEGTSRIGGQEHMYLEPNVSVCQPIEDDEMVIYASTQACPPHRALLSRRAVP